MKIADMDSELAKQQVMYLKKSYIMSFYVP
jgi:hypothetical protein